jgi:hypothetical protein
MLSPYRPASGREGEADVNDRALNDDELRIKAMCDTLKFVEDKLFGPIPRYTNRLLGLEDTIVIAAPDYCEAAESILTPMMAALRKRYEFSEHRQEWADVESASEKLFEALMAADQAEES